MRRYRWCWWTSAAAALRATLRMSTSSPDIIVLRKLYLACRTVRIQSIHIIICMYVCTYVCMLYIYYVRTKILWFYCAFFHSGTEIDMWSFACLLPELRTAVPAFAGESELDQLAAIAEVRICTYIHACIHRSK
jgi:hypothetical protein